MTGGSSTGGGHQGHADHHLLIVTANAPLRPQPEMLPTDVREIRLVKNTYPYG